MVVDVLRQMRERLEADMQRQQALAGQAAAAAGSPPATAAALGTASQVYAYTRPIPDDLWVKCPACNGVMFREDFAKAHSVCALCGHHYRIDSRERLGQVADPGSFIEWDAGMTSLNPLDFPGYTEKIDQLQKSTGLVEAVICGQANIDGHPCVVAVMDGRFMMGSMGSVVGEKITRLFERATALRLPAVVFSVSGGARMQEGIVSLMQMAKTSAAVGRFQDAGLLFISVMTDPTTGGVTASFASLGDIILSEPGTLIGFAGRRVIEDTIAEALPEGFQRAEFLLEHGFLDLVVPRSQMKQTLALLLDLHEPGSKTRRTAMLGQTVSAALTSTTTTATGATAATAAVTTDTTGPSTLPALLAASAPNLAIQPAAPRQRKGSECLDIIRTKNRPVIGDYLPILFDDLVELHGDRFYKDDYAIWGGIGRLDGRAVTIIGHRKGRTIEENTKANFGMPHPEGYRKAMRLMRQAEKFSRPVILLIDTPGAYCGVGAEERGQGEAIASNLRDIMQLKVPLVASVMGEGGSGGALAIGVCDELAMLSNALYSVISPRGFASILWKDPSREREAADILRITAGDLSRLGICDQIIPEPPDGAHTNLAATAEALGAYLRSALRRQTTKDPQQRLEDRYAKFRRIGSFQEETAH